MLSWLWRDTDDLGSLREWSLARRQHAEAVTERLLLGSCSPAIVVGNRVHEQVIADRERRARELSQRSKVARFEAKRGA